MQTKSHLLSPSGSKRERLSLCLRRISICVEVLQIADLTGIRVTLMAVLEVHLATTIIEREITNMMTREIIIKAGEDLGAAPSTSMEVAYTNLTEEVDPLGETDRTFQAGQ